MGLLEGLVWSILVLTSCFQSSQAVIIKLNKGANNDDLSNLFTHVRKVHETGVSSSKLGDDVASFLELSADSKGPEFLSFETMEYYGKMKIDDVQFSVLFDTSSSNIWLPGQACVSCCHSSNVAPEIKSDGATPMLERFPDGTWFSGVGQQATIYLGDDEGGLEVPDQQYFQIFVKGNSPVVGGKIQSRHQCLDSVVGLGFSSRVADPTLSHQQLSQRELQMLEKQDGLRLSLIDRIYQLHIAFQPLFAIHIDDKKEGESDLEIGSYSPSRIDKNMNPDGLFWVSAVGFPDFRWAFNVPRIQIGEKELSLPNIPARISSAEPYIALPEPIYKEFRSYSERVSNPCQLLDSLPSLSFLTTGSSEHRLSNRYRMALTLCPRDYALELPDGKCDFAVVPTRLPVIVLGTPFLRKFYTVFNIESKKMGFAQKTNYCGDSTGGEAFQAQCRDEVLKNKNLNPEDLANPVKVGEVMKEVIACIEKKMKEPTPFLDQRVIRQDFRRTTFVN